MIGAVRLRVADLEGVRAYYETAIGLRTLGRNGDVVRLGADAPLLELVGDPDAPPAPPRSTGLFHFAILVPSRPELARAVRRVIDAGERFTGASDHFVSEALYLRDPEGNGIEIYRDRPREQWNRDNGELRMATLPLDLDSILGEVGPGDDAPNGMPAGTTMGHVHLQVADVPTSVSFYRDVLGFDLMAELFGTAAFFGAGGYHHHVGANVWHSRGAQPPPDGTAALREATVVLPDAAERDQVAGRVADAGQEPEPRPDGVLVRDPSGINLLLAAPV